MINLKKTVIGLQDGVLRWQDWKGSEAVNVQRPFKIHPRIITPSRIFLGKFLQENSADMDLKCFRYNIFKEIYLIFYRIDVCIINEYS